MAVGDGVGDGLEVGVACASPSTATSKWNGISAFGGSPAPVKLA